MEFKVGDIVLISHKDQKLYGIVVSYLDAYNYWITRPNSINIYSQYYNNDKALWIKTRFPGEEEGIYNLKNWHVCRSPCCTVCYKQFIDTVDYLCNTVDYLCKDCRKQLYGS